MTPLQAPYGLWDSPLTVDHVVENAANVFAQPIFVDPVTSKLYLSDGRPSEGGRVVLVDAESGKDVIKGPQWNIGTSVHEYGGGGLTVRDGVFYFSQRSDNRVYRYEEGDETPVPVTPESDVWRFADFDVHPTKPHLLVSVLEDHTQPTSAKVVNSLCIIDTSTSAVTPLVLGADFYAQPRFSPDGRKILWQQWFHPDMSWTGSEVYIADFDTTSLSLSNVTYIAGERRKVSVVYPTWASGNTIIFLSDSSGYYQPFKYVFAPDAKPAAVLREPTSFDINGNSPAWTFGWSFYTVLDDHKHALFTGTKEGRAVFFLVDIESGEKLQLDVPYITADYMRLIPSGGPTSKVVFVGDLSNDASATVQLSITPSSPLSSSEYEVKKLSSRPTVFSRGELPRDLISLPQPMTLTSPEGQPIHVVYWPPTNPAYSGGLDGEKPPCVVSAHGGPTALAPQRLDLEIQFYTTRGWAWLEVNYRGSSGYGRQYMDALNGQWGVADAEDCIAAARLLSDRVDTKRMVIRGPSAGGYTVLSALSSSSDPAFFAAGTSRYGIADVQLLMSNDMHKFEMWYIDFLIRPEGQYESKPEKDALFTARSPISHLDKIVCPLLILQGDADTAIPPSQAQVMYDGIKANGGIVEKKVYEGEGHGFRRAESIRDSMERELNFYERMLKLKQ
ncbi:Alpha/Beta hydrolase protein [Schizophyllum amplum]|uniref:Alpha/Beta hydrolase protein n=1 Tax=Schizophyllum amplum TaxID=97359 RepID=A0A550CJA8_9AGAR|nr:Alpha/Beta hydrolase protein [Auriculariopsis ampla]